MMVMVMRSGAALAGHFSLHSKRALSTILERSGVAVVGANVMDMVAYTEKVPAMGETVLGSDFRMGFGGKGANQAVMAARISGCESVRMVSKVGRDDLGKQTTANFTANGVDATCVGECESAPTGAAAIVVDSASGDNCIVVVMGANDSMTSDEIFSSPVKNAIARSRILTTQLEIPFEVTRAALRVAKENGVITVLNTAPAPADGVIDPRVFQDVDIVCPNTTEASQLTGVDVQTDADAVSAGKKLIEMGSRNVVMTLGKRGAVWIDASSNAVFFDGTPDRAIDTVGAGDCFVGALAGILDAKQVTRIEDGLSEAISGAVAISGISVTRQGTQSSYPSKEEARRIIASLAA